MGEGESFYKQPIESSAIKDGESDSIGNRDTRSINTFDDLKKGSPDTIETFDDLIKAGKPQPETFDDLKRKDPDTIETFDDLIEKDSNKPETFDDLIKAERIQNKIDQEKIKSIRKKINGNNSQENSDGQYKKRESEWDERREEIKKRVDEIGGKMDEGIVETVTAFNILNIPTSQSCEGHADWGIPTPWVIVEAENESAEDFKEKNKNYRKTVENLVKNYYEEIRGNIPVDLQIKFADIGDESVFRLYIGSEEDYNLETENLNDQQRSELEGRLSKYKEEMKKFTDFIKSKYLKEGDKYLENLASLKSSIISSSQEKEKKPEKLFRALTVNPEDLSIKKLKDKLVPGNVNESDPTKIGDGNELGVYMSTNQKMVEYSYARGRGGRDLVIKVPKYNSGYGIINMVRLPSCGLVLEINTDGLDIRKPEITEVLKGVYNNGFEGDEWIADTVPASNYQVKKMILSNGANDRNSIIVDINGTDDLNIQKAIDFVKKEFSKKKKETENFRNFLDGLTDKERMNEYLVKKGWKKYKESNK